MTLGQSSWTRDLGRHVSSTPLVASLCIAVLVSCTGSSELNEAPSPIVLANHHVDWDPDSGHVEAEELRRHALGDMLATPSPATRFAFARASFPASPIEPERLSAHDALHVTFDSNVLSLETKGHLFRVSTT